MCELWTMLKALPDKGGEAAAASGKLWFEKQKYRADHAVRFRRCS